MSNIIRFRVRRKGLELTTLSAKEAAEKALAGFRPVSPEKTETFRKDIRQVLILLFNEGMCVIEGIPKELVLFYGEVVVFFRHEGKLLLVTGYRDKQGRNTAA